MLVGKGVKFERIRRITGYLTGSVDRWNTAKQAEELNRTKQSLEDNKYELHIKNIGKSSS